jgi:hypothetical protein
MAQCSSRQRSPSWKTTKLATVASSSDANEFFLRPDIVRSRSLAAKYGLQLSLGHAILMAILASSLAAGVTAMLAAYGFFNTLLNVTKERSSMTEFSRSASALMCSRYMHSQQRDDRAPTPPVGRTSLHRLPHHRPNRTEAFWHSSRVAEKVFASADPSNDEDMIHLAEKTEPPVPRSIENPDNGGGPGVAWLMSFPNRYVSQSA